MLFGWNLTVENITFSSILIRWTNLTNVLNRKVRHYIVFLNRRNNTVTLHQVVNGDQLTTEINGLTYSTNFSVEVVGVDTMGKPYKTPSEATVTANRKGETPLFFCFCFCLFVFFSVKRSVQFRKSREIFLCNFPYLGKNLENRAKVLEKVMIFFLSYNNCFTSEFFSCCSYLFQSCLHVMEKALFLCSCVFFSSMITYLITLSVEKKYIVLEKKLGKVLNFGSKICTNKQIINFEICYF